jgi:hypothetical protein
MDAKTLEALKASIAKWERNARVRIPETAGIKSDSCPLCKIYINSTNICDGCPVAERVRSPGCTLTPWRSAFDALTAWRHGYGTKEQFHAAARE